MAICLGVLYIQYLWQTGKYVCGYTWMLYRYSHTPYSHTIHCVCCTCHIKCHGYGTRLDLYQRDIQCNSYEPAMSMHVYVLQFGRNYKNNARNDVAVSL